MFAPLSHRSLISLAFSPLENTASFRDVPVLPMGRSQAVRQRILVPPCGGSNPPAPANRFNSLAPLRRGHSHPSPLCHSDNSCCICSLPVTNRARQTGADCVPQLYVGALSASRRGVPRLASRAPTTT